LIPLPLGEGKGEGYLALQGVALTPTPRSALVLFQRERGHFFGIDHCHGGI